MCEEEEGQGRLSALASQGSRREDQERDQGHQANRKDGAGGRGEERAQDERHEKRVLGESRAFWTRVERTGGFRQRRYPALQDELRLTEIVHLVAKAGGIRPQRDEDDR